MASSPVMSKAPEVKGIGNITVPSNTNLIVAITGVGTPTLNGIPFEQISTEHRSMRMWQFRNPPKGTVSLGGISANLAYFVNGVVVGFGKGGSSHTGAGGSHETIYSPCVAKAVIIINVSGGDNLGASISCNNGCGGVTTTSGQDYGWWWGYHTSALETSVNHRLQIGQSGTPTWSFGDVGIVVGKTILSGESLTPLTENGIVL